jgi:hypothetical protein
MSGWLRVTRRNPCPICSHPDYCCRTADGLIALCMRVQSDKPSKCSLGGWIHKLADPLPPIRIMPKPKKESRDWGQVARELRTPDRLGNLPFVAKALGVERWVLDALMVGYGYDPYHNHWFSSWPELNAKGVITGIIRRFRSGEKKMMEGGSHGVYFSPGLFRGDTPIFIVEGGSDTASLIGLGCNVIGRPSALGGTRECTALLRDWQSRIIVIGERDEKPEKRGKRDYCPAVCKSCMHCWPGLAAAKLFSERLQEALGREVEYGMLPAKDAREWVLNTKQATGQKLCEALCIGPPRGAERADWVPDPVPQV